MGTILTVLLAGIMVVVLPYAPRFAAGGPSVIKGSVEIQ